MVWMLIAFFELGSHHPHNSTEKRGIVEIHCIHCIIVFDCDTSSRMLVDDSICFGSAIGDMDEDCWKRAWMSYCKVTFFLVGVTRKYPSNIYIVITSVVQVEIWFPLAHDEYGNLSECPTHFAESWVAICTTSSLARSFQSYRCERCSIMARRRLQRRASLLIQMHIWDSVVLQNTLSKCQICSFINNVSTKPV